MGVALFSLTLCGLVWQEMAARNIHLKMFGVVPMADCEMLFPDKRVYIKPFVMLQLIITLVIGFITALLMLCSVSWGGCCLQGILDSNC